MDRILVAYDGGEPAKRALHVAAELGHAFGASVGVVSVVPVHLSRAPVDPWDDKAVHERQLREAQETLRMKGIEPALIESGGDPAVAIERVAAEGRYDVIVVGTRELGPIGRALQGSVSAHVATHARATVVVAR